MRVGGPRTRLPQPGRVALARLAPLTFPPAPFLSLAGSGRGATVRRIDQRGNAGSFRTRGERKGGAVRRRRTK